MCLPIKIYYSCDNTFRWEYYVNTSDVTHTQCMQLAMFTTVVQYTFSFVTVYVETWETLADSYMHEWSKIKKTTYSYTLRPLPEHIRIQSLTPIVFNRGGVGGGFQHPTPDMSMPLWPD